MPLAFALSQDQTLYLLTILNCLFQMRGAHVGRLTSAISLTKLTLFRFRESKWRKVNGGS
ncbi:MAG: hypothetical protein ACTS5F_01870 [Candidatus Hodgkinia cicadicola]